MKVEKGFKKPLARQIREGVEIEMSEATLLNSKSEWNHARIPRIIIEEGERQSEDTESGLGKQVLVEKKKQLRKKEVDKTERERNKKRKTMTDIQYELGAKIIDREEPTEQNVEVHN